MDIQCSLNNFSTYQQQALHDATWHGHTDAVNVLLLAGVRQDLVAWDGLTPLLGSLLFIFQ